MEQIVKWIASSRWSLFLYCPKRNSDQMTIEKANFSLLLSKNQLLSCQPIRVLAEISISKPKLSKLRLWCIVLLMDLIATVITKAPEVWFQIISKLRFYFTASIMDHTYRIVSTQSVFYREIVRHYKRYQIHETWFIILGHSSRFFIISRYRPLKVLWISYRLQIPFPSLKSLHSTLYGMYGL